MNPYIGSSMQLYGVEEVRLVGSKGDGMRFYQVRNGAGLEFSVSLSRAADLSRLTLDGINFGFFSSCGYVSPAYYDDRSARFLDSFTAGFMTTCGLSNIGEPCTDAGEELPLHGTISNIPAESASYRIRDGVIFIYARMRDASALGREVILEREYRVPVEGNTLTMIDRVENTGIMSVPFQVLYHCNVGYPLLDEKTILSIPSKQVKARNKHAETGLKRWFEVEKPQRGYEEMCFYHTLEGLAQIKVYHPELKKGFVMEYDSEKLPCFTQWKMMGERDYVMGVEPGNAYPDGRDVMRRNGMLTDLAPGESKEHQITFTFLK